MKLAAFVLVVVLALAGGGCGLSEQFVKALETTFDDYRASADPAIDRDPTLSDATKKALKAESAEIKKALEAARGAK